MEAVINNKNAVNPIFRRQISLPKPKITFGWKLKLSIFILKKILAITVILTLSFTIQQGSSLIAEYAVKEADKFYTKTLDSLPPTILPKESKLNSVIPLTLNEAIERVAREQKIPVAALAAMVEQESSNNKYPTSKLEERTYFRLLKSHSHLPQDQIKELARGHGPAHVMGITALEFCNMHYADLYDNYKGLTCAAKYLRMQLDKVQGDTIEEKLWEAFKRYNGTGEMAEKHADKVYALMEKKLIQSLEDEV